MRKLLAFTEDLLTRHGIFHFLDYGTLLGAVRSGTLIAWDDDADFSCLAADLERVLALQAEVAAAGFWLDSSEAPELVRIRLSRVNYIHADLWFQTLRDGYAHNYWGSYPEERFRFPVRYLEQLGTVTLENVVHPAPMPVDRFLAEHRYGPDFMTPDRASVQSPTELRPPDPLKLNEALFLLQEVNPSSALYERSRKKLEGRLEIETSIPTATPRQERKFLTIATIATHDDDYDGVFSALEAIRLDHPEVLPDVEFLVIDNNPTGPSAKALKALESWAVNYRYVPYRSAQGTVVRDLVMREASGVFVLCIDEPVLFAPGSIAGLIIHCWLDPTTNDMFQGIFGSWSTEERGTDPDRPPFEAGMEDLRVFACRREAWPGLNPRLAGFGGEEGYLHEKIRRGGGVTLCLPFLQWMYPCGRRLGTHVSSGCYDRIRNRLLIQDELGLDSAAAILHFEEAFGKEDAQPIVQAVQAELTGPFHFFDAIYCINLDRQPDRWDTMRKRFRELGIERRIRRFSACDTPLNPRIGIAMSHRRIIAEAKRQQLQSVLVVHDDVRFSTETGEVFPQALRELEGREWRMIHLGGTWGENSVNTIEGCKRLTRLDTLFVTHAVAYHQSVYDAILEAVPEDVFDLAVWIAAHYTMTAFQLSRLPDSTFLVSPKVALHEASSG